MSLLCRLEALHVEECHGKRAEEEDSLMTHRWTSKMEDQGPERTLCTFSCGLRSSACTSLRAKPDRSGRFTSGGRRHRICCCCSTSRHGFHQRQPGRDRSPGQQPEFQQGLGSGGEMGPRRSAVGKADFLPNHAIPDVCL
eukprot:s1200_g20.t1